MVWVVSCLVDVGLAESFRFKLKPAVELFGLIFGGPDHRMISSVQEVIMIIATFICCMNSRLSDKPALKLPMDFLDG